MAQKKTKGKQKIEIKKVTKDEDRMITFSKRKSGIYKKANELVTTCGAEVVFLVFSQAGTAFAFAHPSVEAVADQLKNPNSKPPRDNARILAEVHRKQRIEMLSSEYERLVDELEFEKERGKELEARKVSNCWWQTRIDDLNDNEDKQRMHDAFVELHDGLCDLVTQRLQSTNHFS